MLETPQEMDRLQRLLVRSAAVPSCSIFGTSLAASQVLARWTRSVSVWTPSAARSR
jgi:hypothetical protein